MNFEIVDISSKIDESIAKLNKSVFSTKELIDVFSKSFPIEWRLIVERYGPGGKGGGRHFSSYSYISQKLQSKVNVGALCKMHYEPSPEGYGSRVIRYWTTDLNYKYYSDFPEEAFSRSFEEGYKKTVTVNVYERDRRARDRCIELHGLICKVCERDFHSMYGDRGDGFIHIHHLSPLSLVNGSCQVDPNTDLVPVCPNCHAMIHRGERMLSIEEMRTLWFRHNRPSKKA